jgi:protein-tyrosine phosphatase
MARPLGGERLDEEIAELKTNGVSMLLSLLEDGETEELDLRTERQTCAKYGIAFHTFPIPDRGLPHDEVRFLRLAEELAHALQQGDSLAIHCRAGIGRSSLAAGTIMIRCGISPPDALARISVARHVTVPDTDEQRSWILGLRPITGNPHA